MPLTGEAQFLDVMEKIYAASLDDHAWTVALDSMADLFGAVGVSFELIEKKTSRPLLLDLGTGLEVEGVREEYLQYYGAISPRVKKGVTMPAGAIMYDYDIMTEAEMGRNEYYNDLHAGNGLRYFVSGQLLNTANHIAVVAAQRSPAQGHVGDAEVATMKRLLPHLQQSLDIRLRLAAAQTRSALGLEGLEKLEEGCLIIDRAGCVLHVNGKAAVFCAECDGINLVNNHLSFADKIAARRYDRALARLVPEEGASADMPARDFPVPRISGKRAYLVSIRNLPIQNELAALAWPAAAMVFIRDPARFTRIDGKLLRQSYGLSAAETSLAEALDHGLDLQDVAHERHVAISTVRSQLYSLMAKLDVHRQTDLVRLLAQYHFPGR